MPGPRRIRIATLMMLVAIVALVAALARSWSETRRLYGRADEARRRFRPLARPGAAPPVIFDAASGPSATTEDAPEGEPEAAQTQHD